MTTTFQDQSSRADINTDKADSLRQNEERGETLADKKMATSRMGEVIEHVLRNQTDLSAFDNPDVEEPLFLAQVPTTPATPRPVGPPSLAPTSLSQVLGLTPEQIAIALHPDTIKSIAKMEIPLARLDSIDDRLTAYLKTTCHLVDDLDPKTQQSPYILKRRNVLKAIQDAIRNKTSVDDKLKDLITSDFQTLKPNQDGSYVLDKKNDRNYGILNSRDAEIMYELLDKHTKGLTKGLSITQVLQVWAHAEPEILMSTESNLKHQVRIKENPTRKGEAMPQNEVDHVLSRLRDLDNYHFRAPASPKISDDTLKLLTPEMKKMIKDIRSK